MKENNSPKRILELDALRGLLSISIVIFHYTTTCNFKFGYSCPFYIPWIPYRLQLFAMISGFVIPMIVAKTYKPLDFIVARFSRLYPCYFVAVVLISVLMTLFPLSLPNEDVRITWPVFWANLTMFQEWMGFHDIDGVFWFLAPELAFYGIILFLFSFKRMKYAEAGGVGILILVVLNARYGSFGILSIPEIIIRTRILCFWQYFFAGMLFYNLKFKGEAWWRHALLALCFVVENVITDNLSSVLCFAACLLVFYLFVYGKLSWIAQKPLLFLGSISFNLYLIHRNMGFIIIVYLYKIGANAWLRFIIPTLVSIGVAYLMTHLIEKPVGKFLRDKYMRWLHMGQFYMPQASDQVKR